MSIKRKLVFNDLAERWPSSWVDRSKLAEFSGGILHPRTVANLDSKGVGIKGRVRVGRHIAYPVESVIDFLKERAVPLD